MVEEVENSNVHEGEEEFEMPDDIESIDEMLIMMLAANPDLTPD